MSAPTEVLGWVARAEEDFTLARSALRRKRPLMYGATFHAQQCVEKYLKALLVARGLAFPRTHALTSSQRSMSSGRYPHSCRTGRAGPPGRLCCAGTIPW